jgi:tetratricopeptide (TPR) repeat protein
LREAEAEAATLMGQLVWDASQRRHHDTAVGYLDQAIHAAQELGNKSTEGLAALRKCFVALYGWRDPKAGLALAETAAQVSIDVSQVITGLAVLHTAEAHAMLGSRRQCEQALGAANEHFSQVRPSDPAVDYFSPTQPGRLAGSCYLFLHDARAAARILEETAQALREHSKSDALIFGNLSLAYICQGAIDEAIASLHRAIDVAEVCRGGGGLNVICSAGRQLRRWPQNPGVQDVHDRIMALMAA